MLRGLVLALVCLGVALGDVVVRGGASDEAACCAPGDAGYAACCCRDDAAPLRIETRVEPRSCCAEGAKPVAHGERRATPQLIAACSCGGDHAPSAPFHHDAPPKVPAGDAAAPFVPRALAQTSRAPVAPAGRAPAPEPPPPRVRRA